jgi:hypothetical protein
MEVRRDQRGHFNLIHQETGFKADFYPVKRDPLHHWGLAHVRKVALEEDQIFLAPPEYVMVRKLEYYREGQSSKHLRDIQRMLVGLGPAWSRVDLLKLIEAHGLQVEWAQVPPIPD